MVEKQNVELKLIHMEDVVSKEVEWLWYPYIPYGKITIVEGDPGEGKTTLVLKLAQLLAWACRFHVTIIRNMNLFISYIRQQKMELKIRLGPDWKKQEQIVP